MKSTLINSNETPYGEFGFDSSRQGADQWEHPPFGLNSAGGFLLTTKCNYQCAHCITSSTPKKGTSLELSDIEGYLNWLIKTGKQLICITGGEVLYQGNVVDWVEWLISKISSHGITCILDTNAYWANSPDKTYKQLSRLKNIGLTHIYTSADDYHSNYSAINNVINLVNACRELNVKYLIGATMPPILSLSNKSIIEELINIDATFRIDPPTPFGRAANFTEKQFPYFQLSPKNDKCPILGPNLHADGYVYACCNGIHPSESLLNWGMFSEKKFESLSKEVKQLLLSFETEGLFALVNSIPPRLRDDILGKKWHGLCHMCHHIFSNRDCLEGLEVICNV